MRVGTLRPTSAARAVSRGAVRATRVRRPAEPSRASRRVTAVPTLPVAPTTATCRSEFAGRPSSTRRAWASHGRGGEGVAVRHPDVGAAAQGQPTRGDRGRECAEAHGAAAEADGAVDRPRHPGAALRRGLEQVPGAEGHEDDVPDALAADLDGGHRERRQREAAQCGVVDAVRHEPERPPDPGEVLGEAGARVDEEREAVPCGHDDSFGWAEVGTAAVRRASRPRRLRAGAVIHAGRPASGRPCGDSTRRTPCG